jgi:hypothetical protein
MDRNTPAIGKGLHQVPPTEKLPAPLVQRTDVLGPFDYVQTKVVPLRAEHLERHRIVAYNKNSNMNWAFDLLRTQVLQTMEENGWRTLAITSPTPAAGKTVLAINLAMSIAHHTNKTALLVDFDLRRPRSAAPLACRWTGRSMTCWPTRRGLRRCWSTRRCHVSWCCRPGNRSRCPPRCCPRPRWAT